MLSPRKTLWSTPDAVIDRVVEIVGPLSSADRIVDLGCGDGKVLLRWAEIYSSYFETVSHDSDSCYDKRINCDDENFFMNSISSCEDRRKQVKTRNVNVSSVTNCQKQHPTFVGIDIDPDRIHNAQSSWDFAVGATQRILPTIPYEFHVANAVMNVKAWNHISTTILYVYLTPRGMKQLKRHLMETEITSNLTANNLNDDSSGCPFSSTVNSFGSERIQRRRVIVSYMNPLPETKLLRKEYVSIPHQPDTSYPVYMYEW